MLTECWSFSLFSRRNKTAESHLKCRQLNKIKFMFWLKLISMIHFNKSPEKTIFAQSIRSFGVSAISIKSKAYATYDKCKILLTHLRRKNASLFRIGTKRKHSMLKVRVKVEQDDNKKCFYVQHCAFLCSNKKKPKQKKEVRYSHVVWHLVTMSAGTSVWIVMMSTRTLSYKHKCVCVYSVRTHMHACTHARIRIHNNKRFSWHKVVLSYRRRRAALNSNRLQ